jgi:hypothetical protein
MATAPTDDHTCISSPTPSMTSSFVMLPEHHHSSGRSATSSDDSDDEIVYSISEAPLSPSSVSPLSDDDFVVLSRPRSLRAASQSGLSTPCAADGARIPNTEQLADDLANLAVSDVSSPDGRKSQRRSPRSSSESEVAKGRRKRKAAAAKAAVDSYPSPTPSPVLPVPDSSQAHQSKHPTKIKSRKKKAKKASSSQLGFTTRSIVDDISERLSVNGESESVVGAPSVYEEAVGYITSYVFLFSFASYPR